MTAQRGAVAVLVALEGKGTTGDNCVVNADRIAVELGLSERQVWRLVAQLVDDGWLQQTVKAAPGGRRGPGRRARYRLTSPAVLMSDERVTTSDAPMSDERVTEHAANSQTINGHGTPESVRRLSSNDPERLTFSGVTSDIAESKNGTLPTSTVLRNPSRDLPTQLQVARDTTDADVAARASEARAALRASTR
jgi:hypothetical protein